MSDAVTKVGLAVGTTVGSYRIEEPCGRGGFAVVYRATHDKLKRPAALKVLHAKLVQRDDLVKRFTHEAQTITRIHHPNIVDIYDFGTLPDGRPYFAMEWLEGEALSHELRTRKRFQVHEAVQIAREVASGLGAIHKAGVVHRDLKSNNIMYLPTEAGFRIKLLDFGIAKLMDEEHGLSLPGMVLGTPETMAPEQIRGEEITPRADIYAFGILLYELLTGRLPFRADSDREIHAMQMSAPRPRVTDHVNVSDHFDAIVARCMAIDPSDRYDLISQVIRDLDEAASVQTSPDGPLAIGSVLADSYEITGILGRGGMGIVYEGEHTRLPKSLAIKIISGGIGRDSIARFKREAEIASAIGHANIVRVLDFNKLPDGTPYMVMERLEGEDLAVVLKRGPLDFDRVVSITRQTASALAAAHAAGVVHRDLKPSNIFLSMREVGGDVVEHVTVLDFGVSKIQDSTTVSTDTRALIGTPQYMAPEQAMGENQRIGAGSDQFALACLVYEMLTGKAAFAGDRLAEIVYKVCYSEPTAIDVLVPDLDRNVQAALARAMSKSPADRFEDIAAFAAALTGRPLEVLQRTPHRRMGRGSAPPQSPIPDPPVLASPIPTSSQAPTSDGRGRSPVPAPATAEGLGSAVEPGERVTKIERRTPVDAPTGRANPMKGFDLPLVAEPSVETDRLELYRRKRSGFGKVALGLALGLLFAALIGALVLGARQPRFADRDQAPAQSEDEPDRNQSKVATAIDAGIETAADAATGAQDQPEDQPRDLARPASSGDTGNNTPSKPKKPTEGPGDDNHSSRSGKNLGPPAVPADAARDLDAASKALERGEYSLAERLARRSMQSKRTSRGFIILVKAYCGAGNLGAARDYLASVPRSRRRPVIRYCKSRHDIDLAD